MNYQDLINMVNKRVKEERQGHHRPGIRFLLEEILQTLKELLRFLEHQPTSVTIFQGDHMAITGVTPGGTNTFGSSALPPGSIFPAGTTFTWSVDDTADISITPSADGTTVTTACVAAPAQTSFNLTQTSSFTPPGASAPVSGTALVPILPPPTPTGLQINQLS